MTAPGQVCRVTGLCFSFSLPRKVQKVSISTQVIWQISHFPLSFSAWNSSRKSTLMSPSPLLLLILLVVVVVMATSSFAVHKTQILLQSLKNNGEGIIRNMVGNYLKYQKSNPVERELKKKTHFQSYQSVKKWFLSRKHRIDSSNTKSEISPQIVPN